MFSLLTRAQDSQTRWSALVRADLTLTLTKTQLLGALAGVCLDGVEATRRLHRAARHR
ncbi:hypothetical protein [Nocardia harenae]|uniref:hypothetical protein n=1 Tax=Nocardia harenae TaxID=358707 RepID=UPI000B22C1EC|nr:hypothetical protein [Nocardia harenae]